MLLSEIDRVVQESARKLLQVSVPPVKYWLLVDTLGKDERDPLVQRIGAECRTYPPKVRLLRTQREDGTWPISKARKAEEDAGPGPPVGWTYITMLRNLQLLEDCYTSRSEGHISAALEKILSWQKKEGYILGPKHDLFPLPHYNGYALRNLLIYGMEDDPRVKKLADWLLSIQRHDGGWVIPYLEDVKYLPEYRHMKVNDFMQLVRNGDTPKSDPRGFRDVPSCIWTTMMVVRGLARGSEYRRRRELLKGADFFLDRFFKKNPHEAYYHSEKNWTQLKYPPYPGNGISALYLLTILGYGPSDERMEKPIRWLLNVRHTDGFWWQSDRPHAQKDQWITGFAVDILNRYAKNR
ncbi:MAG: hypothetical protein ABIE25_05485 [Thermoplasmatota archaeon]|nr:hypothetical protein [Candidatus Thermoplasmatota archaeon]MBU1913779.1 hypothetical protein [Candidatus Thermoplasmatota archaeon]